MTPMTNNVLLPPPPLAPSAPTPQRVVPLSPGSRTAPNTATVDAQFNQQKSTLANTKFNQWYGGLPPEQTAPFAPTEPIHGRISVVSSHGINASENTPAEDAAEMASVQRSNARAHFMTHVLPADQDYQALHAQHQAATSPYAGGLVPLAPQAGGRAAAPAKPLDPSVVAVNQAKEDLIKQNTRNAVAATQPGGKDYERTEQGRAKLGLDAARLDAMTKQGQDRIAAAAKVQDWREKADALKTDAKTQQEIANEYGRFSRSQTRSPSGQSSYPTPDQINAHMTEYMGKLNPATTQKAAPSTTPPSPAAAPNTPPIPGAAAPPPAGRGRGVVAPVQTPAGRGSPPPGQLPYTPGSHDVEGAKGMKDGKPVEFHNGQWQFVG